MPRDLAGSRKRRLQRGLHAGLPSLATRALREFWKTTLETNRAAAAVVGPKTFYITTQTNPAQVRVFFRATSSYVSAHFGPNDGFIATEDQSVAGFGTVVAVIDAAHTDLTHSFPSALPKRRLRKALIDAIVMAIADPEPVD